jgi:hypothetical protein
MAFIAGNIVKDAEDDDMYNLMEGSNSTCISATEVSSKLPASFPSTDYIYSVTDEVILVNGIES